MSHIPARLLADLPLPLSRDQLCAVSKRIVAAHASLAAPGGGRTIDRWRDLAAIAAADLCLAKILEAHYDAVTILSELGSASPASGELWAMWAAEPPTAVLAASRTASGHCMLDGTKAWCSGADVVSHALVTARDGDDRLLVRAAIAAPGVSAPATSWDAVGMQRVVSGELSFAGVEAAQVGAPGAYLARPGFWHGGAGIAVCWHGATAAIAETLRRHPRINAVPSMAQHLGVIDIHLAAGAALLRETAALIDSRPAQAHISEVMRVRSLAERTALDTIERVGRALGPGPLCLDRAHAQRCADLATFVRQSHADRDWQALGEQASARDATWTL